VEGRFDRCRGENLWPGAAAGGVRWSAACDIGALDGTPIGTVETRIGAAMLKLQGLLAVRDG
jgi:hypothetical protein